MDLNRRMRDGTWNSIVDVGSANSNYYSVGTLRASLIWLSKPVENRTKREPSIK